MNAMPTSSQKPTDIHSATRHFERWLRTQTKIVAADLRHKHVIMGENPFSFLRATYYNWAQRFWALGQGITNAPIVLSVADLHLENFGTWRDGLGRLAWGINDFDEAFPLPYTQDLVRLATSTLLAIDLDHLRLSPKAACGAIMDGFREAIAAGGRPFVIGEEHRWFKPILQSPQRDPGKFWDKLRKLPRERTPLPVAAKQAMLLILPTDRLAYQLHHRQAGLGNLGKPRFTAIADWQGGPVAREAKALTLSAAAWAQSQPTGPHYAQILRSAIRSADPFLQTHGSWVVRRLSPDCRRLELASLGRVEDEQWMLHAMGYETANVHLGTNGARSAVMKHLKALPNSALRAAATAMWEWVHKDFKSWRKNA
jgi:hypothetical protein